MFGGMFNQTPDMAGMPPSWLCYIQVNDVNNAVAVATQGGGRLHRGPMEIEGGVIAVLGDPHGAGFAVHHASAPLAAPKPAPKKASKNVSRPKARPVKAKVKAKASAKAKATAKGRTAVKKKAAPRKKSSSKKRAVAKKAGRKRTTASRRRR
jgi:hypothetical protein